MSIGQIEVVVSRPGHPERRLMLQPGVLRLGRAEDNDLVLADVGVSRRHARIIVDEDGAMVEDLGSGNGTLHNGTPVRQHRVQDGDQVQIEPFLLQFKLSTVRAPLTRAEASSGARLVVIAGEQLAPNYPITPSGLSMGRATDQSIVLHDPGSSRRHAVISVRQGGFWLEDNGSANGIFVNNTRVWQHLLQNNDLIKIGQVELRFELEGASQADPFSRIWDESGVWTREPVEDGVPPFSMPPPRAPGPHVSTEPTQTATRPMSPGRKKSMQSISIVAGVLAALLIGGLAVVGWQVWLVVGQEPVVARPVPVLLAREPVLSSVDAVSVERRQVLGEALLAADRPMEAVLYFYQALRVAPEDEELKRLGIQSCEEAVLAELTNTLRSSRVSESERRDRYRSALRAARRPSAEDLPLLRTQLADALLLFPEDADLTAALAGIDAALAAVALEQTEQAAALEGEAAREAFLGALVLSPTFESAAEQLALANLEAERHARVVIEQALRLELLGLRSEAIVLYDAVTTVLPGEHLPLERMARARMGALAR